MCIGGIWEGVEFRESLEVGFGILTFERFGVILYLDVYLNI